MSSVVPSWLLKAKVSPPEPGPGHVPREALLQRLDTLIERRFALLRAPAGFGKTTLLAEFSRRKKAQGLVVAWISLDEDDAPSVFGSYLACAFETAGLDLSVLDDAGAWASSPVTYQIGMLARAVDLHAAPCLLALDEVDRLPRETVHQVQRLVEQGPGNLHLGLACRSDPGLDLGMQILDGAGIVVGTEQLRFSASEIDRFFQGTLPRRRLIEVEERTAGWPVALAVYRHQRSGERSASASETTQATADFVRARLLHRLSKENRAFVCELAVFDWIDTDLVDEVLDSSDARARIAGLSMLDGLFLPIGRSDEVRRLHPLVRDCCADLLAIEDPVRKRSLHAGIAQALARRGQLVPAWGHARAAGDVRLAGELVERTGVFEIWLRHGVTRLFAANKFLTPEITASYPRLMLLRSAVLRMSLRVGEAAALYESAAKMTDGFSRDRDGGDVGALAVDRVFTRVVLAGGSHSSVHDEIDTLAGVADGSERGRPLLGARHMVLCGSCYERARFEECRRHAALARREFGEERRFGNVVLDIYLGMAAMAQGRAGEAAACYARARRCTRRYFFSDPWLAVCVDAVAIELDLERNRSKGIEQRMLKSLAELRAIWTDIDAVAVGVGAELTLEQLDGHAVIRFLTRILDDMRAMRSETLSRYVSALLAFYLVEVGRAEEAAGVWRDHALPDEVAELLSLDAQSWRTMEALACARVRLLAAQGEGAAADELAAGLCATASGHGLLRTRLRGLALSMAVAERAGQPERALARLVEFLPLARQADYVRPLVRDRAVGQAVLQRLIRTGTDADTRDAAEAMLARLESKDPHAPAFSRRELQVLAEMRQGRRNKEIAGRLGISQAGVRFHLSNIYRKTGVNRREDAVRAAQLLGVLD